MPAVENDHNLTINSFLTKTKSKQKNARITGKNDELNFNGVEYICTKCQFSTKNLKDYKRHQNTKKHQKKPQKKPLSINPNGFTCLCGKMYTFKSGLSKHKKKCKKKQLFFKSKKQKKKQKKTPKNEIFCDTFDPKNQKNDVFEAKNVTISEKVVESIIGKGVNKQTDFTNQPGTVSVTKNDLETIIEQTFTQNNNITKLLEQNAALIDMMSNMKSETNISYQNCGNKKMTVNFFLNEKCGEAMNLSDFVNNLNISLDDLLYTQQHGYAEGISNIFVKHLQDLNPCRRPIHCCNSMQFYVRDENKWLEDKENKQIDKSIQDLTVKQIKHLKEWEISNPNYLKDDKLLSQWQQLVHEIMGPAGDLARERDKELIIKKLGKTVKFTENLTIKK